MFVQEGHTCKMNTIDDAMELMQAMVDEGLECELIDEENTVKVLKGKTSWLKVNQRLRKGR